MSDLMQELAARLDEQITSSAERMHRALVRRVDDALADSHLEADEVEAILAALDPAKQRMVEAVRKYTLARAASNLVAQAK